VDLLSFFLFTPFYQLKLHVVSSRAARVFVEHYFRKHSYGAIKQPYQLIIYQITQSFFRLVNRGLLSKSFLRMRLKGLRYVHDTVGGSLSDVL
jgi:hypothetical protein